MSQQGHQLRHERPRSGKVEQSQPMEAHREETVCLTGSRLRQTTTHHAPHEQRHQDDTSHTGRPPSHHAGRRTPLAIHHIQQCQKCRTYTCPHREGRPRHIHIACHQLYGNCSQQIYEVFLHHTHPLLILLFLIRFPCQQPLFGLPSAGISRQTAVRSQHPVTGYDDGEWIGSDSRGHRPHRRRTTDATCHIGIAAPHAIRQGQQNLPYLLLERGATKGNRKAELTTAMFEISVQLTDGFPYHRGLCRLPWGGEIPPQATFRSLPPTV